MSDGGASLDRYGTTFALAARWLDGRTGVLVARLYAACRALDDLADEGEPADAGRRLRRLRHELATGAPADPLAVELTALARDGGFSPAPALALVDGLLSDLEPVRIADPPALEAYAYRVAGTVGEMMAPLLGAPGAEARRPAVDLGIAMQLTNIARDVLEDARADRRYLPASWVALEPAALARAGPAARAAAAPAVLRLLDLAEDYYASGFAGLAHLPWRPRVAVAVAGEVYRAIGTEVRARAGAYWRGRAVVPRRKRWAIAAGAALRAAAVRPAAGAWVPQRSMGEA
jgi:phytoene synthase